MGEGATLDLEARVRKRGESERRSWANRCEAVLRANGVDALHEVERDPRMVLGALGRGCGACGANGCGYREKDDDASLH